MNCSTYKIENSYRRGKKVTSELIESSPKRRDKLVIMTEIVCIAKKGTSKTHIMFKASLSFSQLKQYLSLLTKTGLLEKFSINGKEIFKSTPKGIEFMEMQQFIINFLTEDSKEYGNCLKNSFIFTAHNKSKIFLRPINRML